jgi:hypothetical protein
MPRLDCREFRGVRPIARIVKESEMPDLIWIIVIVLIVLALLGYFGRGRFRR